MIYDNDMIDIMHIIYFVLYLTCLFTSSISTHDIILIMIYYVSKDTSGILNNIYIIYE